MRRLPLLPVAALILVLLPPRVATAADPRNVRVGLQLVAKGLTEPLAMATSYDGSGRLFIVERAGRIRIYRQGQVLTTPFLDIRSRVSTDGERGMLGLTFHPSYKSNGYLYVSYTARDGSLRISRFRATPPTSNVASTTEYNLLSIAHPRSNHNGGQITIGPLGYLYISTGDGGGAGDPDGNAQNLRSLLGKILRIDINRTTGTLRYGIPSDNPFAKSTTARKEIWLYGLRNPWRFSFDRATRWLYIGDVGQYVIEEVDVLPYGYGGRNLGWDCREGTRNTVGEFGGSYCNGRTFWAPTWQYNHSVGCAIIGGHVYRGARYRSLLDGIYLYGDYCTGRIWGLTRLSDGRWVNAQVYDFSGNITAFGDDGTGEVLMAAASGQVYRLTAAPR